MQLTLVFLIRAIVHLVLRGLAGDLGRRRLFVLLVVALVLQFSFGAEVFVSFTLFGAVALAVGYPFADSRLRASLPSVLVPILLAYATTALIVSLYLYYALQPGGLPILLWRTDMFSNDLLAFVIPTEVTKLGGTHFLSTSSRFTAGIVEGGAYFGLPLIAMICLGAPALARSRGQGHDRHAAGGRRLLAWRPLACGRRDEHPFALAIGHRLPVLGLALPSLHRLRVPDQFSARCAMARGRPQTPRSLVAGGPVRRLHLARGRAGLLARDAAAPESFHELQISRCDHFARHGAAAAGRNLRQQHAVAGRGRSALQDGQRLRRPTGGSRSVQT